MQFRSVRACPLCIVCAEDNGMRLLVHVPGPSNGGNSRVPTPNGETNSPAGTGANTPVNGTSKDGNVYLACLECKREVRP